MAEEEAPKIPFWLILALIVLIIFVVIILAVFREEITYYLCLLFFRVSPIPYTKLLTPRLVCSPLL